VTTNTPLRLVQQGDPAGPLVLGYMLGPRLDSVLRAKLPGLEIRATAERHLHPDPPPHGRPVVLIGWSAGVQSIRAHLLAGVVPAATIALDGTAADYPSPAAWQVEPWRLLAGGARRGARCAILTCTDQLYTEHLTPGAFMATRHVLERAVERALVPGENVDEGDLHVWPAISKSIDGQAHIRQVTDVLPLALDVARDFLRRGPVAFSAATAQRLVQLSDDVTAGRTGLDAAMRSAEEPDASPDTEPSPAPPGTRGERLLAWMRAEQAAGVMESPPGSNTGPRIREYLAACVRGGKPLGLTAGAWCCASATYGLAQVSAAREDRVPVRAAGVELQADAVDAETWHAVAEVLAGTFAPAVGDLVVCERGAPGSWERHVCVVSGPVRGAALPTLGGNEADRFGDAVRPLPGSVLGFVSLA